MIISITLWGCISVYEMGELDFLLGTPMGRKCVFECFENQLMEKYWYCEDWR